MPFILSSFSKFYLLQHQRFVGVAHIEVVERITTVIVAGIVAAARIVVVAAVAGIVADISTVVDPLVVVASLAAP